MAMSGTSRVALGAHLEAALLICASTALFGIGDAIIKHLTQTWPVPQIILIRAFFALPMLLLLRGRGEPWIPVRLAERWNLLRAAFEIGVTFFFFSAVRVLPLGEAVCIMFVAPILLTAIAALFLGERVGWRRWSAVALGFLGVLVVMRPGGEIWTPAAVLPLLAACCIAGRDVVVRRLDSEITTRTVVTTSTLALLLAAAVAAPFDWAPVDGWLVLGAAVGAGTVTSAFLCYVRATRIAEVSFVQPIKYMAIPYAFLLGWLFWGDVPDALGIVGAAMVVGSGLFILERRRKLARG